MPSLRQLRISRTLYALGEYLATVFKRVKGEQINKTDFTDDITFTYLKALGKLHQLSRVYLPNIYQRVVLRGSSTMEKKQVKNSKGGVLLSN